MEPKIGLIPPIFSLLNQVFSFLIIFALYFERFFNKLSF